MAKKSKLKVVAKPAQCNFFNEASWHRWFGFILIALSIPIFFFGRGINAIILLIPSILLIIVGKREQYYAAIKTVATGALFILTLLAPILNILYFGNISYNFGSGFLNFIIVNDSMIAFGGLLTSAILLAVLIKQRREI